MGSVIRAGVVALAAAGAAAALVFGLARSSSGPSLDPTSVLSVRTALEPQTAGFGERVTARVTVLVDRNVVDLSRVRVGDDLAPLTVLGAPRERRSSLGRTGVLTIETAAVCLSDACTAASGVRVLRLRPVQVVAPKAGGGTTAATAPWQPLSVRGRVLAADLRKPVLPVRADTSVPAASFRIGPATLSRVLDVLAALLAAAGVLAAAREVHLRRSRRLRAASAQSALERALALARQSERRSAPDRRRAVALLARLLRERTTDLSGRAGELAWSERQPTPEAVSELVVDVTREARP